MIRHLCAFALISTALAFPASAQTARVVVGCSGLSMGPGDTSVLNVDETGKLCIVGGTGGGGGGGGATGSVTAAGTNGTLAQAVQGINGGVPVPVSGTFFQATQPVSGTFWQATQPISATALPLPSGAATAANQNVTAAGTTATSAQAVQGVTGGVPQNVAATSWPLPAGASTDASVVALAPKAYTLASNAAAAGTGSSTGAIKGATYIWSVEGAFAGLSATLQMLGLDNVTWSNLTRADGTTLTLSSAGSVELDIAQSRSLRIALTGTASGTPSIYSALGGVN